MKPQIIRRINLYRCPIGLKEPFIISLGKLEFADNVIVVVETSEGIKGFGECSPFQTIHGENSGTCMLVGKILSTYLIGKDDLDISQCSALMDTVIYGNTSIKSAIDIALHDIASQVAGVPLYRFLGGENSKKIFTDYTVSIGAPEKMAEDAFKIVQKGFPVIKVKLGGKEEEDFLRMKMIREKVGNEIPIRIDANQGWTVESVSRILNKLQQFNIQHCEEPISRKEFMSLTEIKAKSPIPIMADESCFDEVDAQRLIALKACDSLNIKLGKSGGIFKAKKIIQLAEKEKMKLQAGGFLESRLGFTAMAHLTLSSNQFEFYDFDTPLMFKEDVVEGGIEYSGNGLIKIPDTPGLGATVPDTFLQSLETISVY
jgi:L-alanine-DL-glutamate epimerase-like enolase superfamily enzyme